MAGNKGNIIAGKSHNDPRICIGRGITLSGLINLSAIDGAVFGFLLGEPSRVAVRVKCTAPSALSHIAVIFNESRLKQVGCRAIGAMGTKVLTTTRFPAI